MINYGASIQLADKMTPILNNIISALDMTISTVYDMQSSVDGFDASGFDTIRETIAQAEAGMQDVGEEINRNTDAQGQFNNRINQSISSANNLSGIFSKIASGLGLYKIGSELMETASAAVEFASDLTEVQNVVDVTFGSASATVDEWATNTLDAFGINELSAKQYAGTMGAMLKSSGIAGDAVSEMSMSIAELSGDMASFYNLSGDEAFNKIRSGISGETEPLKQLGINMSVANLEAYALAEGIAKPYEKMSQGEQTLLRYNYLMSATADAQGDFARTSDSYANQTKLLSENWSDFTGKIAAYLLPKLTEIVQSVNNLIAKMQPYTQQIASAFNVIIVVAGNVIDFLANGAAWIAENWSIIGPIFYGVAAILAVLAAAWVFQKLQLLEVAAAQALANIQMMIANSTMLTAIVIIIAVVAAIFLVANAIVEMTGCANSGFSAIVGGIYVVGAWFENLWYLICNIGNGISTLFDAVTYNFRLAFHNAIAHVQSWFYGLLSTATTVIAGICELLNKLPFVEFDYSGIVSKASEYAEKSAAAENSLSTSEYKDLSDAFNAGFNTYDTFEEGWAAEAFANGTAKGDNISEKLNSLFSAETIPEIELGGGETDYSGYLSSIEDSAGSTAGDTSDIKDTVSASSDDELEWLRKIAERETVNRFTTAEIKLDFQSNATINSDIDLDGFINTFTEELGEVLVTTAEGLEE